MSGHVKQFEGIKWYSKGKLSKDLDWDDEDDEFVLIELEDIRRGLDVYYNGELFGTIEQIKYNIKPLGRNSSLYNVPSEITILQPNKMRFICPITKFYTYKFQKKK